VSNWRDDDIARACYTGYRFSGKIFGHAVWLYFRFPLGLRIVEKLRASRGIIVSHEAVRQWAIKPCVNALTSGRRREGSTRSAEASATAGPGHQSRTGILSNPTCRLTPGRGPRSGQICFAYLALIAHDPEGVGRQFPNLPA
jgi:hypothetical protein